MKKTTTAKLISADAMSCLGEPRSPQHLRLLQRDQSKPHKRSSGPRKHSLRHVIFAHNDSMILSDL